MGEAKRRAALQQPAKPAGHINIELVLAAHDALHKGDIEGAHELLHKSLCMSADDESPIAPLAHMRRFDLAFATACKRNGVRAAYLLIDPEVKDDLRGARLLTGGDADLCRYVETEMRKR